MIAGGGIGTIVIALIAIFLGVDPRTVLQTEPAQRPSATQGAPSGQAQPADERAQFVSAVLADTEDVWGVIFPKAFGRQYENPKLVLFTDAVESACGFSQAAVGPFYCAEDQRVYIDLSFYDDLKQRFGAPGDFAQAYVIAHEVGHHVQELTGVMDQVHNLEGRGSERQANALSVRLELQADCYAGVWGYHAQKMKNILEPGDLDEALNAASAIGDDRRQMESRGRVSPDSFTHGSSAQRVEWFRRGFESGEVRNCDTFGR
jgi:Predicted metalloprotease